ncbi:hypothetical protein ACFO0N_15250 [Halobium salinum]|uniref:Uncharacterized protein n=1 Tax=Halobium salinum TaxID=1364940 RepID=A0ABD5PFS0_9EURY|nr:hypothetical protein [Halobium salinum]
MEVDASNPDFSRIGIPGGLGKELDEYEWTDGTPKGASPRAGFFGNTFLNDVNFGEGNTVNRLYLKGVTLEAEDRAFRVDTIGYERPAQLAPIRDKISLDVPRMRDVLIRNPMVDILDAVDVDVDAAIEGQQQMGLAAFGGA